jgi:hypothetical protein
MEPLDDILKHGVKNAVDGSVSWADMPIPIRRCCVCGQPCLLCVSHRTDRFPVHEEVCLRKLIKMYPDKFKVEPLPKGDKFIFR